METTSIARSILLFALAGLCEIAGGYLVWLWLRDGRAAWLGALGGLLLFLYGVLPTLQPEGAASAASTLPTAASSSPSHSPAAGGSMASGPTATI